MGQTEEAFLVILYLWKAEGELAMQFLSFQPKTFRVRFAFTFGKITRSIKRFD